MSTELENRHWGEIGRLEKRIQELEKENYDIRKAMRFCFFQLEDIKIGRGDSRAVAGKIMDVLINYGNKKDEERDLSEGG